MPLRQRLILALGAVYNQTKNYAGAENRSGARNSKLKSRRAGAAEYELAKDLFGRWGALARVRLPMPVKPSRTCPNWPRLHVLLGNILLREGNALQARQEYETYLKTGNRAARWRRGRASDD